MFRLASIGGVALLALLRMIIRAAMSVGMESENIADCGTRLAARGTKGKSGSVNE